MQPVVTLDNIIEEVKKLSQKIVDVTVIPEPKDTTEWYRYTLRIQVTAPTLWDYIMGLFGVTHPDNILEAFYEDVQPRVDQELWAILNVEFALTAA